MSSSLTPLSGPPDVTAERTLEALNQAALAIASELDSSRVLQQIVEAARELIGCEYAALGIPDRFGGMKKFIYSGITAEEVARMEHPPRGMGLLGALVRDQRPIRVDQIEEDTRSAGFPRHHPAMTSFLGVPIIWADESLGNLYLTNKLGDSGFSEQDQRLLEMLAAHAAIAIQNAHLYEEVERLAVLEERTRIGMDLHDGVIQSIYAVGLTLESTRLVLPEGADEASELLELAIEGLNDAIRDIRNFILDLRPRRFKGNLSSGVAQLIREFQANTMVPVEQTITDNIDDLPTSHARALFLTMQEGLANIARHARASYVTLSLVRSETAVALTISDNGQGFNMQDESRQVGHGLANMQARAEGLNGRFRITSAMGEGTSFSLVIPLEV